MYAKSTRQVGSILAAFITIQNTVYIIEAKREYLNL